jgi:hypothetical protein
MNKKIYNSDLEKEIAGNSLLNVTIISELKHLLPQLLVYLNKVILINSGFSKKFSVIHLKDEPTKRCYLTESYGTLYLNIDIHIKETEYESGGYGVSYFKKQIQIGKIQNNVLISIESLENIIYCYGIDVVYDIDKIRTELAEIKRLKEELAKLTTKFSSYGFTDNVIRYY